MIDSALARQKAEQFRRMHHGGHILVLPNAWDAASAVTLEQEGFDAIATTSAGVAWTLGYPDGQRISRDEMLGVAARIAGVVRVPVSADLEAAYAATPGAVADTMREAIAAGVAGVNFEDSTGRAEQPLEDIERQVEKIRAICEATKAAGVPLVLNARVDTYLRPAADEPARFAETVRRAQAYREAGADCIFVIGLRNGETIGRLVREIPAPLNILTGAGAPSIAELEQLGVARVSFGSGIMGAALGFVRRIARELRDHGSYAALTEGAVSGGEMNKRFS
jgi:2-methylisocitrate lyase-like PEP mutase family enzyme